jgi:hypothetical protein
MSASNAWSLVGFTVNPNVSGVRSQAQFHMAFLACGGMKTACRAITRVLDLLYVN